MNTQNRFCWGIPLLFLGCLITCSGCRVHTTLELDDPIVAAPEAYHHEQEGQALIGEWWKSFETPVLNDLVVKTLEQNLELKQFWDRIVQACASAKKERAAQIPAVDLSANATKIRTSDGGGSFLDTGAFPFSSGGIDQTTTRYFLSGNLSYEVDLWRRIDSRAKAAGLEVEAACEDLETAALLLTGAVVDLWFTIQEQRALLDLFERQISLGRTFLELVELRFSVGEASALDVYQQRLQLADTEAQVPGAMALLQTSLHQLRVLQGRAPDVTFDYSTDQGLVALPSFPAINTPCALLERRPDLRALHRRLMAADHLVAAALADRFPRLDLTLSYGFNAEKLENLLRGEIIRVGGDILTPIIDGGRRRAEVDRQKAVVCELLHQFRERFLVAIREVEDAIVQEKYQLELIEKIEKQLKIAHRSLSEARLRYANGLDDYLSVIAALQSLQNLERREVSERKGLLVIRSNLYRALGGPHLTCHCLSEK